MLSFNNFSKQWIVITFLAGILLFAIASNIKGQSGQYSPLATISSSFVGVDANDKAGWSVAFVGDVNKDGYEDLLIGAPINCENGLKTGAAYLIFGSSSMPSKLTPLTQADVTFLGEKQQDWIGTSVAGVGDVNGDGYSDFVMASYKAAENTGKIYLIFGKKDGWLRQIELSQTNASFIGEARGDSAGFCVSAAGDINDDGLDDFLIGAPRYDGNQQDEGKVYLILGKKNGWETNTNLSNIDVSFIGKTKRDQIGTALGRIGDINNDGIDDFAIGAPREDKNRHNNGGRVYLFFGGSGKWASNSSVSTAEASLIGQDENDLLGAYISNAGDANGDGIDDFLVSASLTDGVGKVYLIFGKASGWTHNLVPETFAPSFIGEDRWNNAGKPCLLDDLDLDGFSDLLIGASLNCQAANFAGKVYHIAGKAENWSQNVALSNISNYVLGENAVDHTGHAISTGDFDGDGYAEIAISAPESDASETNAGIVYLYQAFTKPPTSLKLTSPDGGEFLTVGDFFQITWDWEGTFQKVKIEYSYDNGSSWNLIDDNMDNDGDYDWTVPDTPSEFCLVRISEQDTGTPVDVSDAVFTISAPIIESITITAPNGGESWTVGDFFQITWDWEGTFQKVKIEYSYDDGLTWNIINNCAANDGDYDWTVPDTPSEFCLVRISEKDTGDPVDVSDAVFTISSPIIESINITSPNGGECWLIDSIQKITWTSSNSIDSINIKYSINGGSNWSTVIDSIPDNGSFDWTIPTVNSKKCLVKIVDIDDYPDDVSDDFFTICSEGYMILLTPNGGECLIAGDEYEITWKACCIYDEVKLKYSTDNGSNWTCITTTPNDGSYLWTVPDVSSDQCLVRVMDPDGDPYDDSDDTFTICSEPLVTVIAPNGGECLKVGQQYKIKWEVCCCLDSLKIQYSTNSGANWETIVYGTENDGCYWWTVPDIHSDNCLIKVADLDCDPFDISDEPFTIWGHAPVTVISPNGGECLKPGDEYKIRWEAACWLDSLKIQYSTNGGTNWETIITPTENDSLFTWLIPNTPSDSCLIKVADLDCDPYDISDAVFEITGEPGLKVISPNGGETLTAGIDYEITWSSCDPQLDSVKIQYSVDSGENWTTITAGTANDSSYYWTVPNMPCDSCLIKIADFDCDPFDISDSLFTISGSSKIDFDANVMTGTQPLEVQFINFTSGTVTNWYWDFGDGHYSEQREPVHPYNVSGIYNVTLKAYFATGADSTVKPDFIRVYEQDHLARLDFISGSVTLPGQDWSNAINGDTYGLDGTVITEDEQPSAIFCVADSVNRSISGFGLLTDTGMGYEERWVQRFQVQVSVSGVAPDDFRTVLDTDKSIGAMELFEIDPVAATFVKLIVLSPETGLSQLGEFEVYLHSTNVIADNEDVVAPSEYRLAQNYPNPFNPTAIIKFDVPKTSNVKLVVYNLLGEEIRTLVNEVKPAGTFDIIWDGNNYNGQRMASGIYLYIFETANFREVKKMILTK